MELGPQEYNMYQMMQLCPNQIVRLCQMLALGMVIHCTRRKKMAYPIITHVVLPHSFRIRESQLKNFRSPD